MQVAGAFQLARDGEGPCVDLTHPAILGEAAQHRLGVVVVVGGDEDVEWPAGDLALDERAGEGRVEGLCDLRAGDLLRDLLGSRAGLDVQRLEGLRVDGFVMSMTTFPSSWSP